MVCAVAVVLGAAGCAQLDDGARSAAEQAVGGAEASPTPNGIDGAEPVEAVKRAFEATKGAKSVTVTTENTMEGQPLTFAMNVDVASGDCSGTVTMGAGKGSVVVHGSDLFLRFDRTSWELMGGAQGAQIADRVGSRWIASQTSDPQYAFLTGSCSVETTLDTLPQQAEKGGTENLDGQKAVSVLSKDGTVTRTLYIAAQGEPYVLKDVETGGDNPGSVTYEDYDKPVTITVPAQEQIVEVTGAG